MNYLLTVLANGRPDYLRRTLDAFFEHVTPHPVELLAFDDGGAGREGMSFSDIAIPVPWEVRSSERPLGMCAAHAHCWEAAASSSLEWAFHLEDDMRVLCPIDLGLLADTMDAFPHLAGMTLKRTPWGTELEHGGFVEQEPHWYDRRSAVLAGAYEGGRVDSVVARWFETNRNWSCAPTLFRTQLAREFEWDPEPGCETEIGPRILEEYGAFGFWGGGECQVAHIGVSRAPGAMGY